MTRACGYTVVELLVASAVLMSVLVGVSVVLHDGLARAAMLDEAADLHQRTRVASETLGADMRAADSGGHLGPLSGRLAAVLPRAAAAPPASALTGVLTVRYVPRNGASSVLVAPLTASGGTAVIETLDGCPRDTIACGFTAGARAVLFDEAGNAEAVGIAAIGPGVLSLDRGTGSGVPYAAGACVAEIVEATYAFDPSTRQLRRTQGTSAFVLADNVTGLHFDYFDGRGAPIPLATLADGPFRGGGWALFDADLMRVRAIRATLRLETGVDHLRGPDPRLFARPGTATGTRVLPDLLVSVHVSLRHAGS